MNIPMHQKAVGKAVAAPGTGTLPVPRAGRGTGTIPRAGVQPAATRTSSKSADARAVDTKPAHRTASAGWSELPSARLKNVKCADPFATKAEQFKTKFGSTWNSGGFPCRLYHSAANVRLNWSKDPSLLDFDPLLVTCAEGLSETEHPYAFASRACFAELLASQNAGAKAAPLVSRIVPSLRAALLSSNKTVFDGALNAIIQLSTTVGEALNPHIHILVVQMNKRNADKDLAPTILKAMQTLEEYGGPEALPIIKAKVPTYCSVACF